MRVLVGIEFESIVVNVGGSRGCYLGFFGIDKKRSKSFRLIRMGKEFAVSFWVPSGDYNEMGLSEYARAETIRRKRFGVWYKVDSIESLRRN
jgi:hypothetical protein